MLILPFVPSIPAYDFTTQIDGADYKFDVRWSSRGLDGTNGAWFFSVSEPNGTPIIAGVKVVLGAYLGRICQHRLFRAGVMIALDMTRQSREAKFDDLGTRVEVRWVPVDEALARISAAGVEV